MRVGGRVEAGGLPLGWQEETFLGASGANLILGLTALKTSHILQA